MQHEVQQGDLLFGYRVRDHVLVVLLAYLALESAPDVRVDVRRFFLVHFAVQPLLDALEVNVSHGAGTLARRDDRVVGLLLGQAYPAQLLVLAAGSLGALLARSLAGTKTRVSSLLHLQLFLVTCAEPISIHRVLLVTTHDRGVECLHVGRDAALTDGVVVRPEASPRVLYLTASRPEIVVVVVNFVGLF